MAKFLYTAFGLLSLFGCQPGRQGVTYREMAQPPQVTTAGDSLIVEVHNSVEQSAKEIFDLSLEVSETAVHLHASQRLAGQPLGSGRFVLALPAPLGDRAVYWVDPDGTQTRLVVKTGP